MKVFRNLAFSYLILLVVTLFIFLCIPRAYSAPKPLKPSSCNGLIDELNAMKNAQNQIILSLAKNHDVFADQLSDLSFELALYEKTVPKKALDSMDKSARAYRVRSTKAQETAQRLEDSTESLITRIQRCLR